MSGELLGSFWVVSALGNTASCHVLERWMSAIKAVFRVCLWFDMFHYCQEPYMMLPNRPFILISFKISSKPMITATRYSRVNLSGVSTLAGPPWDKLVLHHRWQRLWVQQSQGRGASLDIWRDCNPNPYSLEKMLKDPVYHLAKHPEFAKQQNSHSPDWFLPRFDRLKVQPSLKRTVKPSHFFLFHSGKWI